MSFILRTEKDLLTIIAQEFELRRNLGRERLVWLAELVDLPIALLRFVARYWYDTSCHHNDALSNDEAAGWSRNLGMLFKSMSCTEFHI